MRTLRTTTTTSHTWHTHLFDCIFNISDQHIYLTVFSIYSDQLGFREWAHTHFSFPPKKYQKSHVSKFAHLRFASLSPLTAPHMAPHSSLSRAPLCSLTHSFSHHTPRVTDEKQPSGSPPFQNLRIRTPPEAKGISCCVAAVIAAFSHSYSTNWLPVIIKNETTSHSSPTHL